MPAAKDTGAVIPERVEIRVDGKTRRSILFHPALLGLALAFLLARNLPLAWKAPINIFGDEVAHVDYVLKMARGHLARPTDFLEPGLIRFLYPADGREDSPPRAPDPRWMASYSYEAKHPPLFPLFLLPWLKIFSALGCSLTLQIKLLRLVCLGAVAGGIWIGWLFGRRRGAEIWAGSALLVPLLAQDGFFVVSSDTVSFLIGAWALTLMGRLLSEPGNRRVWSGLILAAFLGMGIKAVNVIIFLPWAVAALLGLWNRRDPAVFFKFLSAGTAGLAIGSLWFLGNLLRFGHPFLYDYGALAGELHFLPAGISWDATGIFFTAFTRTLLRGELLLDGKYFDLPSPGWNLILLTGIPMILFLLGAVRLFCGNKKIAPDSDRLILITGLLTPLGLLAGHLLAGSLPFYQARFALFLLLPLLGTAVAGWKMLPRRFFPPLLPISALLVLNLLYAVILLQKM
jgi:hypothetical protein